MIVRRRWEVAALLAILVAAALLYLWAPGSRVVQPYYAAAVHSMSQSTTALLFSGFDPAGVVTIDKPPLAFWVQAVGAWLLGYHWWAIALIQAIEGVAAVFVLHRVVRRWAGEPAALVAALLLALSPITTAVNRDDLPDTLLILLLLLAAYCVTRAVEEGRAGWLVAAGAFVGLGFLAKMLVAWAVLPALLLAYLPAPVSRWRKLGQLALAGVVTLAVSLWWPLLVSLWPGTKPFVGSTSDNSIWQLILGYNGFGRLVGADSGSLSAFGSALGTNLGGAPGPLRLFDSTVGGQIAWFLPLAVGAVVVAGFRYRQGTVKQRSGWLLWGGWLAVFAIVFSFTGGIFHAYYTATLAPAVAATAAVGLVFAWRERRAWLPAAIAGTTAMSFLLLSRTPEWLPWLKFVVLALGVPAMLAVLPRWRAVALAGVAAIVAGPAAYGIATAATPSDVLTAADPVAGPSTSDDSTAARSLLGGAGAAYLNFMNSSGQLSAGQRETLDYAIAQDAVAPIELAVEGGSYGADPYLVRTDARVAALGGYLGLDPAPTAAQLADWVRAGRVRFVLLPSVFLQLSGSGNRASAVQGEELAITDRLAWISRHCPRVPAARIGPDAAKAGVLFDCQ
ncbi:glycosyltransferase family 39 protein [Amycolatopsis acidiphila]|uniref:Phospholipid carrier-dependent glycosyltransferase n=1 Tax=Amycolatopsis acidiphila TaxID=715473 RepID=A0A558ABD3_9PSEU|nr:glycosyltransferase family 39 protein [Amycolatopsis acidiphila]TVT21571.1 phospholipid carrier-dependent glycosyltransferase [Amycolatopsis acidiphila]UIJ59394.1 glycosyltransferase family 39 protein [Amycolatopsis acidiphila]GHG96980.1 membrane protein [Amycolatopsis acidiphila]